MSEALALVNQSANLTPMKIEELIRQVQLVQHTMKAVMQDGTHYGKVPGCGDKPALFKSGAEKLAFVFRLAPYFEITHRDLPNGHREYEVLCTLKTIQTGFVVSQGVGACSTMEGKYRFRTGPKKFTGKPVPKEYWTVRQTNPSKAADMIGGPGHFVAKNDAGEWEIIESGGKIEYENPADYFNTCLKMAKKRAQVDATLTGTAASDCFNQDVEELEDNLEASAGAAMPAQPEPARSAPRPVAAEKVAETPAPASAGHSTGSPQGAEWRSFAIPFGKAKGALLGEIPTNNLMWWIGNYVPKPYGNNPHPSKTDLAFRAALDAAKAELERRKEDQDAAEPPPPAPQQENIDEDVPF